MGWRKYPDHLSGDYTLRGHPVNEGSAFFHEAGASHPWTPTRSMGARKMVGVFPPTCTCTPPYYFQWVRKGA